MNNKILNRLTVVIILATALSSCMVGPNFQQVEVGIDSIDTFRFQDAPVDTVMNVAWQDLFQSFQG